MLNTLLYLLLVSLITSGFVAVAVYSEIAAPFRKGWNWLCEKLHVKLLQNLTYCTLCLGFWVSLFVQDCLFGIYELFSEICFSFACAFLCWTLNALAQMMLWITGALKTYFDGWDKE